MPIPVLPGTTIDRYEIEAVIGAGSMGDVYRGSDVDLHRKVAVKILSERHRDNQELRARFVREGRAVAAIAHPNVVQVFTTGTFDGRPYIAMEFLDGIDLGTDVGKRGPWDSLPAAYAIRDAARGLDAAARAGLIHRDVKPSNLVLLGDGTVKVTDFGLAKPLDARGEPALTAMGVVVGTPDYIAPEQARGDPIDHRVDIYALGGTLYFLLTGVPPFRTGRPDEDRYLKVVARHLRHPVPDARERNADADVELVALARDMMAKAADDRPTYEALIERLSAMMRRLGREQSRQAQTALQGAPTDGSGGHVDPTPIVSAPSGPIATSQPATKRGEGGMSVSQAGSVQQPSSGRPPHAGLAVSSTKSGAKSGGKGELGRMATAVIGPASGEEPGKYPRQGGVAAPTIPRWLIAITIVAIITFVVGISLTVVQMLMGG